MGTEALPDEKPAKLRWVAGGEDAAFGHHAGTSPDEVVVTRVYSALQRALMRADEARLAELYALLMDGSALEHVDALLERIRSRNDLDGTRLERLALWLATKAADREPVKVALALLGLFPGDANRAVLMILGRHEDFTLYAAVALMNSLTDAEESLFELAKHVRGWGRIQLVERLVHTRNPQIRRWMLREGFRNEVMNEYLAYVCATSGGLLQELIANPGDDDLLLGASGILIALIRGGPAQDMRDYADGIEVTRLYLDHLRGSPHRIEHLLALGSLKTFLQDDHQAEALAKNGWTAAARKELTQQCDALLALPHWRTMVEEGLASKDDATFARAADAARHVGIDPWEHHFRRLKEGNDEWYFVMQTNDVQRVDAVIAYAEQALPLDAIASGPASEIGLGLEWKAHSALDFVVQNLDRFPGHGWVLMRASLRSPVVRNRNMTLRALASWGRDHWPAEAEALLREAAAREPDEQVKSTIERVLAGEGFAPPPSVE